MDKRNLNISKVETFLEGLIDNKVSDNTFVGMLPNTIQSDWKDMCLIDTSVSLRDWNAYGRGLVLIWLYARPLANGAKNVARMSSLEDKLLEVIENSNDSIYQISRRATYSDYDSTRKWHCNIVELNINIL
jgi:5-methylcytosine-specific restriction endonuclease McrBC regulatory subunit McrC